MGFLNDETYLEILESTRTSVVRVRIETKAAVTAMVTMALTGGGGISLVSAVTGLVVRLPVGVVSIVVTLVDGSGSVIVVVVLGSIVVVVVLGSTVVVVVLGSVVVVVVLGSIVVVVVLGSTVVVVVLGSVVVVVVLGSIVVVVVLVSVVGRHSGTNKPHLWSPSNTLLVYNI